MEGMVIETFLLTCTNIHCLRSCLNAFAKASYHHRSGMKILTFLPISFVLPPRHRPVCNLGQAFGMRVIAWSRSPITDTPPAVEVVPVPNSNMPLPLSFLPDIFHSSCRFSSHHYVRRIMLRRRIVLIPSPPQTLAALAEQSDVVSVHSAPSPSGPLLGADFFAAMKVIPLSIFDTLPSLSLLLPRPVPAPLLLSLLQLSAAPTTQAHRNTHLGRGHFRQCCPRRSRGRAGLVGGAVCALCEHASVCASVSRNVCTLCEQANV